MRLYTAVCAAVLGALGFTACGWQNAPMYGTEPAYGVPTATFRVRGVVTDEENNPVEGIRVAVSDREGWDSDTVYTSADGEFETCDMSVGSVESVRAVLADVDGVNVGQRLTEGQSLSGKIPHMPRTPGSHVLAGLGDGFGGQRFPQVGDEAFQPGGEARAPACFPCQMRELYMAVGIDHRRGQTDVSQIPHLRAGGRRAAFPAFAARRDRPRRRIRNIRRA